MRGLVTLHVMPQALSTATAPGEAHDAVHDFTLTPDDAVSASAIWYFDGHELVTVRVDETPFDEALEDAPTAGSGLVPGEEGCGDGCGAGAGAGAAG